MGWGILSCRLRGGSGSEGVHHQDRHGDECFLFQDKKFAEKCWTHDFKTLIELAELKPVLDAATTANPSLWSNWAIAQLWKEDKRYHRITESEAKGLYDAVSDAVDGVLPWIKTQW
jgi:hypothetical protein